MTDITIKEYDQTYITLVIPNKGIQLELSDFLTFDSPQGKFRKGNKRRYWDGKIRLYNRVNHRVYAGLCAKIVEWARSKGYSLRNETSLTTENPISDNSKIFSDVPLEIREYQKQAILFALRKKRALLVCPTASGKSLIAYQIHMAFENMFAVHGPHSQSNIYPKKTLIIVPTLALIQQMESDFRSYGYNGNIQFIMGGETKELYHDTNIVISTWQSIYDMDKSFFHNFHVIIGDEAHTFKAKSLVEIMEKANHVKYRYGMTGTLDNVDVHEFVLEGLFGEIYRASTTEQLIQQQYLSPLKIHCLVLKHQKGMYNPSTYDDEVEYLTNKRTRNGFICKLASSLKGKTLILFAQIEHGKELERIFKVAHKIEPFYVSGMIVAPIREQIRQTMINSDKDEWMLASYGTTSTGINIPNLDNIIFASSTKSRIRLMQSIGRGLRKNPGKNICNIYDIADNLQLEPINYTLKHCIERIKMYNEESFPYKIHTIQLKEEGDAILY